MPRFRCICCSFHHLQSTACAEQEEKGTVLVIHDIQGHSFNACVGCVTLQMHRSVAILTQQQAGGACSSVRYGSIIIFGSLWKLA